MSRPTSLRNPDLRPPNSPSNNNNNNNHTQHRNNSGNTHEYQRPVHSHSHGHSRGGSRQTHVDPRQPRQQLPPTSDYESDAVQDMPSHRSMLPPTMSERSNTELNIAVLKRYLPSITNILSIAANAVVYTFQQPEWKKTLMEGTMFICSQRKSPHGADSGCLFILNRKGLRNLILDLDNVGDFELAGELLIFKLNHATQEVQVDSGETVTPNVLGVWTYAEDKSDRETNAALIYDMWAQLRNARAQADASDPTTLPSQTGAAVQAGRRVSMTDLFSAYNGNKLPAQAP
ncbi:PH domain-like protein [Xylaria nigripes]|nr:PH domain-like protein [Xylaria nigripes]